MNFIWMLNIRESKTKLKTKEDERKAELREKAVLEVGAMIDYSKIK